MFHASTSKIIPALSIPALTIPALTIPALSNSVTYIYSTYKNSVN